MNGIIWSPKTLYWAWTIICMPKMNIMMPLTCGTDTVATHRSRATRRLSHGRVDGVTAVWHRVDAIDANLKFRNRR